MSKLGFYQVGSLTISRTTLMNPSPYRLSSSSANKRKRAVKICPRCGFAGDDEDVTRDPGRDLILSDGNFARSYMEWLESERATLISGIQKACQRLMAANLWPNESLPPDGQPLNIRQILFTLDQPQILESHPMIRVPAEDLDPGLVETMSPLIRVPTLERKIDKLDIYRCSFSDQ
ncbi:hypothetical protein D6D27_10125 [Aureobasidium pullulans]|nr:hypothetical protein D6D27_10125 [Aureobasidium pullulans]